MMTSADLLPAAVLERKAVVYVRQSTQTQVQTNLESQRRQYDLVGEARRRGFRDVEVIDDDLGRSASGTMARPGFDRLVAWLCAGEVGAVLCFDGIVTSTRCCDCIVRAVAERDDENQLRRIPVPAYDHT